VNLTSFYPVTSFFKFKIQTKLTVLLKFTLGFVFILIKIRNAKQMFPEEEKAAPPNQGTRPRPISKCFYKIKNKKSCAKAHRAKGSQEKV